MGVSINATTRPLTPTKETKYELYRRLGKAPGAVCMGAEYLAAHPDSIPGTCRP